MGAAARSGALWFAVVGAVVVAVGAALLVVRATGGPDGPAVAVADAYIPEPASPNVAAVYFTLRNSGSAPDTLESVSTDVSSDTMLMETTSGTMSMTGPVTVPAHGTFRFSPGHYHVMITNPQRELVTGDSVRVTLTFKAAGAITVDVPVRAMTYRPDGE